MAENKRISFRPSEGEEGGQFGFPVGATVEITSARCDKWENAGPNALKGRSPLDPALVLVGDVEGQEEPVEVYLGAGKATRMVSTDDGEFFEPAEGSSAHGLNKSSNAFIFLESLCDKKAHGKNTVPDDFFDDGISRLVGLKFIVGSKAVTRDFKGGEDDQASGGRGKQVQNVMVADRVLALPTGKVAKKAKPVVEDDDEDGDEAETPAPKKVKKPAPVVDEDGDEADDDEAEAGDGDGDGVEAKAEAAINKLLAKEKYAAGISVGKVSTAIFSSVKDDDDSEAIVAQASDMKWLKSGDRPWHYEKENKVIVGGVD